MAAIVTVGATATSSFWMVPVAVAVVRVALVGLERVTVNPSSGSTVVSPDTLTVMTLLVSPAAKLTVPVGKVPPKSAAFAALAPDPVTAQAALLTLVVSPSRVTVKVKALVPELPSVWLALVAAIVTVGATVAPAIVIVPLTGVRVRRLSFESVKSLPGANVRVRGVVPPEAEALIMKLSVAKVSGNDVLRLVPVALAPVIITVPVVSLTFSTVVKPAPRFGVTSGESP